jgi:hypothetical protein
MVVDGLAVDTQPRHCDWHTATVKSFEEATRATMGHHNQSLTDQLLELIVLIEGAVKAKARRPSRAVLANVAESLFTPGVQVVVDPVDDSMEGMMVGPYSH